MAAYIYIELGCVLLMEKKCIPNAPIRPHQPVLLWVPNNHKAIGHCGHRNQIEGWR